DLGGQWHAPVEDADVIEPQKPTLKDVVVVQIFPIHPPRKVEHQFVEDTLEEHGIPLACPALLSLVYLPCRPGMDRRIGIAEGPFIGGELPRPVHITIFEEEKKMLLCKNAFRHSPLNPMESPVPRPPP